MTTNQTINGVPRELALRLLLGGGSELVNARKELRALLDAPVCKTCGDSGWVPEPFSIRENMLECPECKPDAQPQGEPVAWQYASALDVRPGGAFGMTVKARNSRSIIRFETRPLYAEQPAPVAVVLPERREISPTYPYLSDLDIEWNACLDEVTRLNGSKP